MTDIEKLVHFMNPFYQEAEAIEAEGILTSYLAEYTYPECAAAALWEELKGSLGLVKEGLLSMVTGAETFKYASPDTVQKACTTAAALYTSRCNKIKGIGSCAIRVSKTNVGGSSEADYKGGNIL